MSRSYFEFENNTMNTDIQLNSWSEFYELLKELGDIIEKSQSDDMTYSVPIFRGVKRVEFNLQTTLERYDLRLQTKRRFISEYSHFAKESLAKVNSFLGTNYKTSNSAVPFEFYGDGYSISEECSSEEIGGWIFLRHHGFPSPILDWTKSPFIAAYFAFRDVDVSKDRPVVYLMLQCSHGKLMAIDRRFYRIKYDGITHSRHYLQQCEYTIALEGKGDDIKFWQYRFRPSERSPVRHNSIIRITIPPQEKYRALSELQTMNINEYSLFMTNDSLVRMIADRDSLYSRIYMNNKTIWPGDLEFE